MGRLRLERRVWGWGLGWGLESLFGLEQVSPIEIGLLNLVTTKALNTKGQHKPDPFDILASPIKE